MNKSLKGPVEFGEFRYDPGAARLTRDGAEVPIQPRPCRLLELFLANPNSLLEREQLQNVLWEGAVVDYELSLNYCIRNLRAVLGDSSTNSIYIQTVPRRGYRFVADVVARSVTVKRQWSVQVLAAVTVVVVAIVLGQWLAFTENAVNSNAGSRPQGVSDSGWEAYRRGIYIVDELEDADRWARSIPMFQTALEKDPDFSDAYAQLARSIYFSDQSAIAKVRPLLSRALAKDHRNIVALTVSGIVAFQEDWDMIEAESVLETLLKIEPNNARALHILPLVRAIRGDLESAMQLIERYSIVDPEAANVRAHAGWFALLAGENETALGECNIALEIDPDWRLGHECAAMAAKRLGLIDVMFGHLSSVYTSVTGHEVPAQVNVGRAGVDIYAELLTWLDANSPDNYFELGRAAAMAGDKPRAMKYVGKMLDAHDPRLPLTVIFPEFESIRCSAEFRSVIASSVNGAAIRGDAHCSLIQS